MFFLAPLAKHFSSSCNPCSPIQISLTFCEFLARARSASAIQKQCRRMFLWRFCVSLTNGAPPCMFLRQSCEHPNMSFRTNVKTLCFRRHDGPYELYFCGPLRGKAIRAVEMGPSSNVLGWVGCVAGVKLNTVPQHRKYKGSRCGPPQLYIIV